MAFWDEPIPVLVEDANCYMCTVVFKKGEQKYYRTFDKREKNHWKVISKTKTYAHKECIETNSDGNDGMYRDAEPLPASIIRLHYKTPKFFELSKKYVIVQNIKEKKKYAKEVRDAKKLIKDELGKVKE